MNEQKIVEIKFPRAEAICGQRVDRRRKYATTSDSKPDEMGAVLFELYSFTDSCSGCYESNEGYNTGYPVHPVHKCPIGNGCSECGYHGVVRNSYWVPSQYTGN